MEYVIFDKKTAQNLQKKLLQTFFFNVNDQITSNYCENAYISFERVQMMTLLVHCYITFCYMEFFFIPINYNNSFLLLFSLSIKIFCLDVVIAQFS